MLDQKAQEYISTIVRSFYTKATQDILIGYHFRKIQQSIDSSHHHPLRPPMEAFEHHLPRINEFWMVQLGVEKTSRMTFDLIEVHRALSIRPGELGRWLALFRQTLEEDMTNQHEDLKNQWLHKLNHFEAVFKQKLF